MQFHDLTIIQAGIKDAEVLTDLSVTTFRDAFGPDNNPDDMDKYIADEMNLQRLTEELGNSNNIFFIAWHNKIPVGYAKIGLAKIPEQLNNYSPIEIERLYVLRSYQSKKIGAAIMKHCINHAIKQKYNAIWLGVWEHNLKAIKFYKQFGFELFGAHNFILGNDKQTDLLLKKIL